MNADLQDLVAAIKDKSENKINDVILKLRDLVDKKALGDPRDLEVCKQSLYSHGVLHYCSSTLRSSPATLQGGYGVLTQMAELLSTCCVGLGAFRDNDELNLQFLPSVVENHLFLVDRLMNRILRDKSPNQMIRLFRKVFDCIAWLIRDNKHLIHHVLKSKHYESVQICEDDDDVSSTTLNMWYNIFRTNSSVLAEMGSWALTVIMDDLVYKMSSSSNPVIGRAAVKTLVLILDKSTSTHELIHRRYKGLADLAEKDWRGKGFETILDQLIDQLQSDTLWRDPKSSEDYVRAACVIQAAWRAHQTRKRLKKLPRAISKIQRSFREKRRQHQENAERQRVEEELRHHVCLRRQRAMREFRQHQLQLIMILPADQVQQYLGELEKRAALVIQRVWRGHRARLHFQQHKHTLRRHRAAVTLQRAITRFLKHRRAQRSILTPLKAPKGLSDSRRNELKKRIEEHISLHPSRVTSAEGSSELHQRAQSLLQQHLVNRVSDRACGQHTQALLAQINTDIELLLNAPSLKDAQAEDVNLFLSRSCPVATRARQSHNTLMQSMRLPWWRTLGEEFEEPSFPEDLRKDYDTDIEALYLGGE